MKESPIRKKFIFTLALMLAMLPTSAMAHDGVGGDELAVANWMLVAALITVILGLLAMVWAWRNGQFSNIEASKYSMLEMSDDYDAIYAPDDDSQRPDQGGGPSGSTSDRLKPNTAGTVT